MTYDICLNLAREHKFSSFTQLQEVAFRNDGVYEPANNLFVIGETSSGKTLIPLLLYEAAIREALENGDPIPKMVFVVPYRALAAQKLKEICGFYESYGLRIVQSTGEFRQNDEDVCNGNVDIAVIITEKAFRYEACDAGFLSQYDYVVLDEVGLINDPLRGVRIDFLFAWALRQRTDYRHTKVVVLATPFYDWSEYIRSYGFIKIHVENRPVCLQETEIIYSKNGVEEIRGACSFLRRERMISQKSMDNLRARYETPGNKCERVPIPDGYCSFDEPCRHDMSIPCPHTGEACENMIRIMNGTRSVFEDVLVRICREQLLSGKQVLVFVNDRERVKLLCSMLYKHLQDLLPPSPSAEECKKTILEACGLDADDVFGILDNFADEKDMELFRAFYSGIGFHCASLPNQMRTYVEKQLLNEGNMRIVCSTETLAFGVNSSLDTVVIADIQKNDGTESRPLSMNEYQNYAGRAGRLRHDVDAGDIKGYVYVLLKKGEVGTWEEIKRQKELPKRLYSLFYDDQNQFMPFFILNLLPVSSQDVISEDNLVEMIRQLPHDDNVSKDDLLEKVGDSLRFLCDQGMVIAEYRQSVGRRVRTTGVTYCLTELGKNFRGYVVGCNDYLALVRALEEYIGNSIFIDGDRIRLLYRLLKTKHAENGLNNVFHKSQTLLSDEELRAYIRDQVTDPNHSTEWIDDCRSGEALYVLAALLAWCDGESPRMLYRRFGIHYALLSRLAEQISYLIEIISKLLPSRMERTLRERGARYGDFGVDFDLLLEQIENKSNHIRELYTSVFFGVHIGIATELLEFARCDAAASGTYDPIDDVSLHSLDPDSARQIRRMVVRYKFFASPPPADMNDVETRNNYLDQMHTYKRDISRFSPRVRAFFKARFPDVFSDCD